ncbi:hypothetical protein ACO0LC_28760 [Undibacterium sp. JH2W]|uniref:hypothetical protein n=1 Tax=Undibacterium sp. JH2W TaxID=3413037 RepID=UPI003BF3AB28
MADTSGVAVIKHLEEGVVAGVELALVLAFSIDTCLRFDVAVGVVVLHPFYTVFAVIMDLAEDLVVGVIDVAAGFCPVFTIALALVDDDELVVFVIDEDAVAVGITKGADAVLLTRGINVVEVLEGLVDLVVDHVQAAGNEVTCIVVAVVGFLHAGFWGARVGVGTAPQDLATLVVAAAGGLGEHAAFAFGIQGDVATSVVFPVLAAAIAAGDTGAVANGVVLHAGFY